MGLRKGWCFGVAAAVCLVSVPAWAEPPPTANQVQIGAGFRYGFELEEGDFNPWGTGLGISGGYTMPNAIYAGGVFDYFLGESREEAGLEMDGNIWQLMGEAGYDLGLGNLVLRPKAGIGVAGVSSEVCVEGECSSDSGVNFAIAPGATFILLTSAVTLTVDLRYDMIFDDSTLNALILSAGIGF